MVFDDKNLESYLCKVFEICNIKTVLFSFCKTLNQQVRKQIRRQRSKYKDLKSKESVKNRKKGDK